MRILFVTHNFPRHVGDAAGSFVLRLAVALQDIGTSVTVIAPGAAGLAEFERIEDVAVHRVRYGTDDAMTLAYGGTMAETVRSTWLGKVALVALLRAMRRDVRSHIATASRANAPYDVVHVHWWFPAGLALWRMPRAHRLPIVLTMHGSDVRLAQGIAPARRLMRSVLAGARVCTAVSSWLADTASRIAGDTRVRVEPMPVDAAQFVPPPASAPERAGILFVGRLNAQKGLAFLIEALANASLSRATLDVVGDGPDRESLRALAESRGVSDRITWHGALPQPDLVPRYQRAVALAIPSTEEGLGLVAVEAQLCETPVVAFDSGGLTDVVRPDAGGTRIPPGDVAALATSLARLLTDRDAARDAGRLARSAMLLRFAPQHVAERYRALYDEAIA